MSENMVLRIIFGPKTDEVIGGCRKLHNEELHKLHSSPNNIRIMKSKNIRLWACSTHGDIRNAHKILLGKPEGKRTPKTWA
jgi:hypothetical protein